MNIVTFGPVRAVTRASSTSGECATLTILCKTTFTLLPGQSQIHPLQEDLNDADLISEAPHAEVVLIGSGFVHDEVAASRLVTCGLDTIIEPLAAEDSLRFHVAEISADARIVLENLHADHPTLTTALPSLRPRVRLERSMQDADEIPLVVSTLSIDVDRGLCVLVWRGSVELLRPGEPKTMVVSMAETHPGAGSDTMPIPAQMSGVAPDISPPAWVTRANPREDISPWAAGVVPSSNGQYVHTQEWAPPEARAAPPARAHTHTDALRLIWFDPESAAVIRAHPPWRELLVRHKSKPLGSADTGAPPPEPQKIKDQREVFEVLASGEPEEAAGISRAVINAIDEAGKFTPPLCMIAGELHTPFDEAETLKATAAAMAPFAAGDMKLKEAMGMANALLDAPLRVSGGVAASLTALLRDAFGNGRRAVSLAQLEALVDRALLEQRHYQKRTMLGQGWIRCLFIPQGGSKPLPAFLPEAVGRILPTFQRTKVRLVAEVDIQQDQYETDPILLRVLALARVVPISSLR